MITQSFLYNAIFFTYALVLTKFYHVSNDAVPVYGLAFAVGNLAGPLLLGHLFDTLGRKKMIAGTYLLSGSMLAVASSMISTISGSNAATRASAMSCFCPVDRLPPRSGRANSSCLKAQLIRAPHAISCCQFWPPTAARSVATSTSR